MVCPNMSRSSFVLKNNPGATGIIASRKKTIAATGFLLLYIINICPREGRDLDLATGLLRTHGVLCAQSPRERFTSARMRGKPPD